MSESRNKPNGRCNLCPVEVSHIVSAYNERGRMTSVVRMCEKHAAEAVTRNPNLRVVEVAR